jgi:hypothetical protein
MTATPKGYVTPPTEAGDLRPGKTLMVFDAPLAT